MKVGQGQTPGKPPISEASVFQGLCTAAQSLDQTLQEPPEPDYRQQEQESQMGRRKQEERRAYVDCQ